MINIREDKLQDMYRLLVEGVTDYAIYMLSPEGMVISWNAGARRAKGYTADEIVGRHFSCFYEPSERDAELPQQGLAAARATGRFEAEGWRLRKDGSRFWAHVVINAIEDENGALVGFAKITRDCSEKRQMTADALAREQHFRLLVQGVTDYAIYMLSPEGEVTSWNAGAERAKGYTADEIVGRHFSCFYEASERQAGLPERGLATVRATGRFEAEGWRLRKDGSRFWANVVIDAINDDQGQFVGFAKITRDCSEKRAAAVSLQDAVVNLDLALANIAQGLCLIDATKRLVLANEQLRTLLGISPERPIRGLFFPTILRDTFGEEGSARFQTAHLEASVRKGRPVTSEFRHADRILSVTTRSLNEGGWVSTVDDVTENRRNQEAVHFLAHHDVLTQLPNRATFQVSLSSILSAEGRPSCAVLFLDLDRFKPVNDTYGHAVGDALLKAVADRLQRNVRQRDLAARLGGDEFAIILYDADYEGAVGAADRVVKLLGEPFRLNGSLISIGCSVGIAVTSGADANADDLLKQADAALYQAKRDGRNRHRAYDAGLGASATHRACVEADLRRAVQSGAFELHYQPIVRSQSGRVVGYEALLRWNRNGRPVSPVEFIPIAEEAGLMPELGAWVMNQACREAVRWPSRIGLSINLSPAQLRDENLVDIVAATLDGTGLPAGRLELEITETAILADKALAIRTLSRLRAMGVALSLDDFGTGYSSLSFVNELPITRIKIDRSFIDGLEDEDTTSVAIVRAILGLGRALKLKITAEGVETAAQRDFLVKARCSHLQGYLFGRPVPVQHLDLAEPPGPRRAARPIKAVA